jgi:phage tail P2-like protein
MNLLPPNASPTEKALCESVTPLFNTPFDITFLYQPAACPTSLLPFLGWSVSVDNWNESLSESQKRHAIATSIDVHRKKGTRAAMNTALDSLGFDVSFKEWFEQAPLASPFTFSVKVDVQDKPFIERELRLLEQTIAATKNARSHLSAITLFTKTNAQDAPGIYKKTGGSTLVGPMINPVITTHAIDNARCFEKSGATTFINAFMPFNIQTTCHQYSSAQLKTAGITRLQNEEQS